ncbi:MAG: hypothetical protein DUD32_10375 [Lactobacillus sp.]|nr:MAG: hypothetical protein DUD32_10375 [Lactobacillus sp.]
MTFLMLLINPMLGLIYTIHACLKNKIINRWKLIIVTAIVFFYLGISIELTNINADLGKYFSWFPNFVNISYNDLFREAISEKNFFILQKLMLAFFAKLHNNSLFSGFVVSVFYTCYMYIVTTYLKKNNCQKNSVLKKEMATYFGVFIISFGWVLTNVRNPMANAIVAVAIFRDLYLHKKGIITVLLYLLALSMHVAVVPIIICRILTGILFGKNLLHRFLSGVLGVLLVFVGLHSNIISMTSDKISAYGLGSSGGGFAEYAHTSFYYQINNLFLLYVMLFILILITIAKRQKNTFEKQFPVFLTMITILSILSYFLPTPLIDRYGMFVEIFIPLIIVNVKFSQIKKRSRIIIYFLLMITGLFGLAWQIAFLSFQINILSFLGKVFLGFLSLI